MLRSWVIGFRRRWKKALTEAFGVTGAIWLVTEITIKVSDTADKWVTHNGVYYTVVVLAASIARFLYCVYEVRFVFFTVPTTDTKLTIKFGDLFSEQTDMIIGVNEFFDSKIGHVVSQDSLHGKFIARYFNGDEAKFRRAIDNALAAVSPVQTSRSIEPSQKYDIGTTAVLPNGPHKVFLVAMSRTDLTTAKASSTVPLLWDALCGALHSVRDNGNGAPISLPLIGNGRSSVNVEPQHLMRLIVLALVDFGRKHGLPKQVNIIAHEACFEMLDIREIRRDWSEK